MVLQSLGNQSSLTVFLQSTHDVKLPNSYLWTLFPFFFSTSMLHIIRDLATRVSTW